MNQKSAGRLLDDLLLAIRVESEGPPIFGTGSRCWKLPCVVSCYYGVRQPRPLLARPCRPSIQEFLAALRSLAPGLLSLRQVLRKSDVAAGIDLICDQQLIFAAIDGDARVRRRMALQIRNQRGLLRCWIVELYVPRGLPGIEEVDAGVCGGPVCLDRFFGF